MVCHRGKVQRPVDTHWPPFGVTLNGQVHGTAKRIAVGVVGHDPNTVVPGVVGERGMYVQVTPQRLAQRLVIGAGGRLRAAKLLGCEH